MAFCLSSLHYKPAGSGETPLGSYLVPLFSVSRVWNLLQQILSSFGGQPRTLAIGYIVWRNLELAVQKLIGNYLLPTTDIFCRKPMI